MDIVINLYSKLIQDIGVLLQQGRTKTYYAINRVLLETYWKIGEKIINYEQHGKERAEYGSNLLNNLSKDLKLKYGKGFSRRNVLNMRNFYLFFPKWQTVSAKLNWSHYVELLSISDEFTRSFYEKQSIKENWSVRELKRQRQSGLFERLALSKDKQEIMELSKKGLIITSPEDAVKDPYILEFLNIPETNTISESYLEKRLIDNLGMFLLELGKGFSFVGRQYRLTINNTHFFVDLVFYHNILKCYVLMDLKIGKVHHQDIGQMNMYLNYFKEEENREDDNEPIGIVLAADKDEIMVKYATGSISNKLFVSQYKLYLPDKKELEQKLKALLREDKKLIEAEMDNGNE